MGPSTASTTCSRTRSPRSSWPTSSATTTRGGRAPLPRGVLALLRARGVPRRRQPAHHAHPARPRRRPAADQPSDPRGRARGHARPALRRARGAGAGRGPGAGRAASLRRARAREARGVGGGGEGAGPRASRPSTSWEWHGQHFDFPARNVSRSRSRSRTRRSGWRARTSRRSRAPAAGAWARSASSSSRRRRRARGSTATTSTHAASGQARGLPDQPEHRDGERVHVRADRRGGAGEGGGLDVLRVLPVPLRQARHPRARRGQHVGALPGVAAHAEGAGDAAQRA